MEIIAWNQGKMPELVELWNQEVGTEYPMRKALFAQNSFADPNVLYENSYIALDDSNRVIGFIVSKRWQDDKYIEVAPHKGWIQAILVDSNYRKQGIGMQLLIKVETGFRELGMKEIQFGGDPFHYFPGIPNEYVETQTWAEKHGYEKGPNAYDLINYMQKKYLMPKDETVEISLLEKEEQEELIDFFNRCFPGRWTYEAIKYFEMEGKGREFVVMKKHGKIIGFCRINDSASPFIAQNVYWAPLFEEEIGGIGPLGIDSAEQKQGYGLAIVQAAVAILQSRNMRTIVIDWTSFIDFYGKLDFQPWKSYATYSKKI